jgi:hypothetical protein
VHSFFKQTIVLFWCTITYITCKNNSAGRLNNEYNRTDLHSYSHNHRNNTVFLIGCNDYPEALQNPEDQPITGKVLIDSLIDCSTSDVKMNCNEKIIITIPTGTVSSPVKLKISELKSFPQNSSDAVVIHSAWDVTLDTFHTFSKP